jgi:DNA polymerase (family X)
MQLSNHQIAQVFRDIADSMEALGENRFKTQAYARAAEMIEALPTSLYAQLEAGTIDDLPGVGPAISGKLSELLTTGRLEFRERLREQVPDGALAMMRLPGVGPKTALRLHRELGITTVDELAEAAQQGRIRGLKGLGARAESRILAALETQTVAVSRFLLGEMLPLAREIIAALRSAYPGLIATEIAGSLRRAVPTIGNVNLVAAAADPSAAVAAFASLPHVAEITRRDDSRLDAVLHNGKVCTLAISDHDSWGATLALWTGSAAHRERLTALAAERGFTLDDSQLGRDDSRLVTPDENAFYGSLGLPWIPPELREDRGEIDAAIAGRLPDLVTLADIRADMHTHTDWSDGRGTIAEMAEAALARGYEYYVISDHSAYMGMVNGLDAARLREQRAAIDAVNEEMSRRGVRFRLLQGIEVDILPDGALALPDEALAQLDWVVASPHVSLRQERSAFTERLLRAIRNPHVDCIGHPTGRKLLARQGADVDMDAVVAAAAETGTVLEIDGAYERLDLDSEHAQQAIAAGVRLAVDSDAHHVRDLPTIEYGVLTARRAWATKSDVVNCWSWDEVRGAAK